MFFKLNPFKKRNRVPVPAAHQAAPEPDTFPTDETVFGVTRAGGHVMPFLTSSQLMEREKRLVFRIRQVLSLGPELWNEAAEPLIRRLGRLVSSLPASEGMHDCDPGGLFRHSLTVALNALEQFVCKERFRKDSAALRLGLLYAALSHDLLKVLTDFTVETSSGDRWKPFREDLEDFMQRQGATRMTVNFIASRGKSHNLFPTFRALLLLRSDYRLIERMDNPALCDDVLRTTHEIWSYVSWADTYSVNLKSSQGMGYINAIGFMAAKLLSMILSGTFIMNAPGADLITCKDGVIFFQEGQAYWWFRRTFRELLGWDVSEECTDFAKFMRKTGMVRMVGANRIYQWYRIEISGQLLYLKGLMVKVELPEDTERCNAVPIGSDPSEIALLLEHFKAHEQGELRAFVVEEPSLLHGLPLDPEVVRLRHVRIADPDIAYKIQIEEQRERGKKEELHELMVEMKDFSVFDLDDTQESAPEQMRRIDDYGDQLPDREEIALRSLEWEKRNAADEQKKAGSLKNGTGAKRAKVSPHPEESSDPGAKPDAEVCAGSAEQVTKSASSAVKKTVRKSVKKVVREAKSTADEREKSGIAKTGSGGGCADASLHAGEVSDPAAQPAPEDCAGSSEQVTKPAGSAAKNTARRSVKKAVKEVKSAE